MEPDISGRTPIVETMRPEACRKVANDRALVLHNSILAAYLAHFLVPVLCAIDSLRATLADEAGICEKVVVAVGTVWILLALSGLALTRERGHFLERMARPLMAFYVILFLVVGLEVGFRVETRLFDKDPLFYKPGAKMVFNFAQWELPGISPRVTFSVNALGLRGPLPSSDQDLYRIIAMGGSTTECGALDDTETWPYLLMQQLNRMQKGRAVWVGNAGVSGLTTVDHLWCLRERPILRKADLLVFLIGINDLEAALEFGGASTQHVLEFKARSFLDHAPPGRSPIGGFFRRTWLFAATRSAIMNVKGRLKARQENASMPRPIDQARLRAAGPILPIPDLRVCLKEYAQRVHSLGNECRTRNLRCAFLTQPAMWRPDLPREDQRLLWFGRVGNKGRVFGYAPVPELAQAMDAYNQTLLTVCGHDRLECYDLASSIPRDTTAFYDDVHFNVGGARMVADFLAEHLIGTPPASVASRDAVETR